MTKKDDINFDYNEEVKKCKTIDDVIGKDGLVQRLIKDVLENILEVENSVLGEVETPFWTWLGAPFPNHGATIDQKL